MATIVDIGTAFAEAVDLALIRSSGEPRFTDPEARVYELWPELDPSINPEDPRQGLDEWQRDHIWSVFQNERTSIRSAHGVGKTTNYALLTMLWLDCWEDTGDVIVVLTAPKFETQIEKILFREITKWYTRSAYMQKHFEVLGHTIRSRRYPKTVLGIGANSNDAARMEGFHACRLLVLVDEAKGVPDDMKTAIDGALTEDWNHIAAASVPGIKTGWFHDTQTKHRDRWNCFHVDGEKSPRVSRAYVENMASTYGVESPVYQAKVKGEFADAGERSLYPYTWLEHVMDPDNWDDLLVGPKAGGVDVARFGHHKSAITSLDGGRILSNDSRHGLSTVHCAAWVKEIGNQDGWDYCAIDPGANGAGVIDILVADAGVDFEIIEVPFGSSSWRADERNMEEEDCANAAAAMAWDTREAIRDGALGGSMPDELFAQMQAAEYDYTATLKIKVVKHKDGEIVGDSPSPDRMESLWLAWRAVRVGVIGGLDDVVMVSGEAHKPDLIR